MTCTVPALGRTVAISGVTSNHTVFPTNSTIFYMCQHHYVLESGSLERTCINGSVWTGEPPVCIPFQVQLMNRTKYVAGGIAGGAFLLGIVLFLDFLRFLRKKMKIKRNTQRRLILEGSQRPLPFLKLNPSVLKVVYEHHDEGYENAAYEHNEQDMQSGSVRKKKKTSKKGKQSKEKKSDLKEAIASNFHATNIVLNSVRRSKKRKPEVEPMQELEKSMQKVLSYDTSTTAYDSSTTQQNFSRNSSSASKKKKKKMNKNKEILAETYPDSNSNQYYSREHMLVPQPYTDIALPPRTQKQKFIAAATIPPYSQKYQQQPQPIKIQQNLSYVTPEMPINDVTVIPNVHGMGTGPNIHQVQHARPLPQIQLSNINSNNNSTGVVGSKAIDVEVSRHQYQEIQV